MTTRTWIGGGNNKAANAKDWSPTGVSQSGDDPLMTQGVMDIAGNALAGDQLTVSGGTVTINTHSEARLDVHASFALLTIADVNVHGTVMLTADVVGLSQLNISGGKYNLSVQAPSPGSLRFLTVTLSDRERSISPVRPTSMNTWRSMAKSDAG
jgi:hypothetical protein